LRDTLALVLALLALASTHAALCQPRYDTYIVVRNTRGEVVSHLVEVYVEGCAVTRLNITHFALRLGNRSAALVVVKDGAVVYEGNLTPPGEGRVQLVEVRARLQHLTMVIEGLPGELLVVVKYADVTFSRYTKGAVELRNVPYPVNLTVSVPRAGYSATLVYRGEEVVRVRVRRPECNVYLKFYDALLRPLPARLVNVTGARPHLVNETHVGLKLSQPAKLELYVRGVRVTEVAVAPPRGAFDVKVVEVKLPVGPLRVLAPPGSTVEVELPSGVKLSAECEAGEVVFERLPACRLLVAVRRGGAFVSRHVDFPGALTISVGLEGEGGEGDWLRLLAAAAAGLSAALAAASLARSAAPKRTAVKRARRVRVRRRAREEAKGEGGGAEGSAKPLDLGDMTGKDLADFITKLKRHRAEVEKLRRAGALGSSGEGQR